jgi:limonene-1,2-epoxide hydrolase
MSPEETIRSFCDAVPRRDAKELASFFSADAIYHNIPIDPVTGPEAIEKMLTQFLSARSASSCR